MKKYFYILNHRFLPTPYTHRFFVEKFAKGFLYHGYEVKRVERVEDIQGPGIMLISNIPFYFYWNNGVKNFRRNIFLGIKKISDAVGLRWFKRFCDALERCAIREIAPALRENNIIVLGWYWHKEEEFFKNLGVDVIYTGEFFYHEPDHPERRQWYQYYRQHLGGKVLPIRFAADFNPGEVNTFRSDDRTIFVSYVGEARYKPEWQALFREREDCKVVPTPPYISEKERTLIYEKSLISLGLQGELNIKDGVVSERIFEALSYGNICLTNHPEAPEATDGAAIFVKSEDELLAQAALLKKDRQKAKELRDRGLAFIEKKGTYAYEAEQFIELGRKNPSLNLRRAFLMRALERAASLAEGGRYYSKNRLMRAFYRFMFLNKRYLRYAFIRFGGWRFYSADKVFTFRIFSGKEMALPVIDSSTMSLYAFQCLIIDPEVRLSKYLIKNLKSDDTFYDVGANHGFYTALGLQLISEGEVHLFEPTPQTFHYIRGNFGRYANVLLNNVAVSDRSGSADFFETYSSHDSGGGTLMHEVVHERPDFFHKISVPTISLDDYISGKIPPSWIKIDAEGAENIILQGAQKILEKYHPTILMEIWRKPLPNETHLKAVEILLRFGYKAFKIDRNGELIEVPDIKGNLLTDHRLDNEAGHDNYVFRASSSS